MRASELAVGASSSRTVEIVGGTTDGANVAEDTTEGVRLQRTWVPGNRTHHLADRRRFAPGLLHLPLSYFNFLCIRDNCMYFCWGWGKWIVSVRVKYE